MKIFKIIVLYIVPVIILIGVAVIFFVPTDRNGGDINSFAACVAAGNPVMESYPRQCRTADGAHFVENIGNEIEKQDLIRVAHPRPNQVIESPVDLRGEARGYWFFEGSFQVKLVDENGSDIALTFVESTSEWMTEDFVPFSGKLEFDAEESGSGELHFIKENVSDDRSLDDALRVPVIYSSAFK